MHQPLTLPRIEHAPIAVVIPCYLCADTIERALASVMEQTVLPTEVWLIEDGSPDGGRTRTKLHELEKRYTAEGVQIRVVALEQNIGAGAARNTGWNAATQPYIAFLDADDAWHPRKLEIQYGWMNDHPDAVMTGHGWTWVDSSPPLTTEPPQGRAWRVSKRRQLLSNPFCTPTVMLHRELPYRFTETRSGPGWVLEDAELWLRIILDGNNAWRLNATLTNIYKAPFGEDGLSGHLWEMARGEIVAYQRQVHEGRLHWLTFGLVVPWLLTKYLRRVLLAGLGRQPRVR